MKRKFTFKEVVPFIIIVLIFLAAILWLILLDPSQVAV